ncbi:MAG: glycosyltransferase [Candidatus Altiarchaeales archaeon]|nr:MAG: glycosyltransferase [Candidatus Altiarchaeales archaeon]HDO82265.1 glycosyltransferase [Candidatus Altiarchaeales archaeon]HEX54914.1 glycosyltransferase [Candidatus Altiarchaeales archaeon]
MVEISIIIPVFNEERNLPELYSELTRVLEKIKKDYEIIFVDDGSTDNSFQVLKEIREKDERVKIIKFRRNFGKSAALSQGFKRAHGEIIFTLDADLQDNPEEIPKFLRKIDQGYDLVVGWRFRRKDPITKKLPSRIFNFLTSLITGIKIHDFNCCFKAFRREVAKNIKVYGELHRYIPVLAFWKGYRIAEIKIEHRPRRYGRSKYGIMRLIKGFLDLITVKFLITYAKRPLHFFGIIGFLSLIIGFFIGLYLLYVKYILNQLIGDRPLLLLSVLLVLVGLQFIFMGLIGEMITSATGKVEEYNTEVILD